ncbi:MAG: acetolactate synthase small subunit [Chloroflexota bacterium]
MTSESVVTVHFTQRFGAVDRIISMLRRRGFPINGLTLERTHDREVGRMTVVVESPGQVEQVSRHLSKLPDVRDVDTGDADAVRREYALVRIRCTPQQRSEVLALLSTVAGRPISMTAGDLVLEAAGGSVTLDRLFAALAPYGIQESARTNPMSLRVAGPPVEETVNAS